MNVFNGNIEETIIASLLKDGSMPISKLLGIVTEKHSCTRQGFYRALRKIRDQEHVVVYKSSVSINTIWLRQLKELLNTNGDKSSIIGDFNKLLPEESLLLSVKGLTNMDRIWSHMFASIEEHIPVKHSLFLYNPHNWSALLRQESDKVHEEFLEKRKRNVYLMIGSTYPLDKEVTKRIDFTHIEFSFNSKIKRDEYVAVIGDYIIELRFSPKARSAVHHIFTGNHDVMTARKLLHKLDSGVVCKIHIECNPLKAQQWMRRIGKDFHVR